MERLWSIAEQVGECQATKFRFEFYSCPTDQSDQDVRLKVWNEARDRFVVIRFDRNGYMVTSDVELALNADPNIPQHQEPATDPNDVLGPELSNPHPDPAPADAVAAQGGDAALGLVQPAQF
jgi:hypothetical protein